MADMHYDTDGGTVLLILAHPDDELMLRPLMEREAAGDEAFALDFDLY